MSTSIFRERTEGAEHTPTTGCGPMLCRASCKSSYLTDEGFHRTCSAFQEECSLFHNGNSELEQVLLTADLKTILEDYSQLKETGRENGIPSSTAVLKSLWKDLDIVIGQLKYATMPNAPKVSNVGSQSTRTRRLNSGRVRRSTLQKNHENTTRTMTNSSTVQRSSTPSLGEGNATEELLLPRLSPVGSRQNLSSPDNNQATNSQSCADGRMLNGVRSNASKDLNVCQTSCSSQSTGVPVAVSIPHMPCTGSGSVDQVTGTPSSCVPPSASSANSHTNNEQLGDAYTAEGMLDVMDDGDACSDGDFIHNGAVETTPGIVINDESSKDQRVTTIEEHSNPSQNELQLRSPKRKGVQPKKRVPQAEPGTPTASDSPVKLISQPANQEVEMDIMCAPDTLTPQSFLDTLLSTPLLQEKLAENINKVVSSSRAQPVNDELPFDSTQSVTTSEASSNDVLMASNQEAGDDIPVKEIMDLMQADPAFDVLFSFFGLDALDALPLETNSRTVLDGAPADSNQVDRSSSPPSTSETNIQVDTLGALSSLATEIVPDLGNAVTTLPGSNQQLDTPSSSSASDLHLSATTIVTDALLLLAGSPQKKIQETGQLSYSTGQHNLITPPKRVHSVPRSSANDSLPGDQSVSNQPALITSTLPYVRALNFTQGQGSLPGRRGRKKGSKNKNTSKKNVTTNEQNKAPSNKKGANGGRKRSVAKKPPELTSVSSSQAMSFSSNSTDISGQPFTNCGSAFNRTIVHHPSPMNVMMPTYCPNPPPHSFGNCVPVPTPLPANVIIPSANCTPSGVACITPVTGLNTVVSPSPVSYTGTLASHFPLPATHSTLGTSPAPSPVNLSTCPTHSPVNFTTSVSVHVPSPFPSGHLPVCSPPVSLAAVYSSLPPAAGHFVNQGMCPTPSSVSVVNAGPVHSPVPPSTEQLNVPVIPSTASMQQVVNTITSINSTALTLPGHFTESTAVSATARTGNSLTAQENCDVGVAIGFRPSASSETVDIGAGGSSTPMEPLALRATNLLQTLAAKHVNTEANSASPQNLPAGPNIGQLSAHSLQNNMLLSTVDELVRHQPLKEKSVSRGNINISQDNTKALNEKQMESIPLGQELRGALPIEVRSLNSQESNSGSTSLLETLSQECSELRKENSAGFLHSKNNNEREIQGSSILERKRQRNAIEPQKKKKTKSSRPSKRSKTEGQRINFPSDLNVEEFLSTLHYEDK